MLIYRKERRTKKLHVHVILNEKAENDSSDRWHRTLALRNERFMRVFRERLSIGFSEVE